MIGNGDKVHFWTDNWVGTSLMDFCGIHASLEPILLDLVSDFIVDNQWVIPQIFSTLYPSMVQKVRLTPLPLITMEDKLIWSEVASGILTAKEAYEAVRDQHPVLEWNIRIWDKAIQPRKSILSWKVLRKRVLVDEQRQRTRTSLCSRCSFCGASIETVDHLFLFCPVSMGLWRWSLSLFRLQAPSEWSVQLLISPAFSSGLSSSGRLLWRLVFCNLLWCL